MRRLIRIGTRSSELALWQANTVKNALEKLGYETRLVPVETAGDVMLHKPLYELGITGIFTKTLDTALLSGAIDLAVHSLKDVPTRLPGGIVQAAVLERGSAEDVLVFKENTAFLEQAGVIATCSLRRKAQWLHNYPHHWVEDIRGNVPTRLQKLAARSWDGAIFAKAGLERLHLLPENHIVLDWMIPAPAQGAVVVVALEKDVFSVEAASALNHRQAEICTRMERAFLRTLEGGCTAPIGALATVAGDRLALKGILLSPDGSRSVRMEKSAPLSEWEGFGEACAGEVLANGGKELMAEIKRSLP